MRYLLLLLSFAMLQIKPLLTHGYNDNCSEECIDYYCPKENSQNKKEKDKKFQHKNENLLNSHKI